MKKQRKTIGVDVYKQGNGYIWSMQDGYQYPLPYYVTSKQDVRNFIAGKMRYDLNNPTVKVRINWC